MAAAKALADKQVEIAEEAKKKLEEAVARDLVASGMTKAGETGARPRSCSEVR